MQFLFGHLIQGEWKPIRPLKKPVFHRLGWGLFFAHPQGKKADKVDILYLKRLTCVILSHIILFSIIGYIKPNYEYFVCKREHVGDRESVKEWQFG